MPAAPFAIVTCGPAYEPIDSVRRITNHSTGELATRLAQGLQVAGFRVLCLRGAMTVWPAPENAEILSFSTNTTLAEELEKIPGDPAAVFHAAALADFSVAGATPGVPKKISSETEELVLTLRPAAKILPLLRPLFPEALIVGWKYEVEGSQVEVLEKARRQITRGGTDACVANGPAYGDGFGFIEAGQANVPHFGSKPDLCQHLVRWTLEKLTPR